LSGLLTHVIDHAVRARSVAGGSQSFGVVALVLLVVLLIEWEAVRLARGRSDQWALLTAISVPVAVVVALTVAARLVPIFTG
jgi:hypothetical protein